MTAFLNQLPALLGVIVGVVGTLLTSRLNDKAQWTRTLSVRWDERRLDAYAEYGRTLNEVHLLAHRITAPSRPSSRAHPIDQTTGLELIAEADVQRTRAWEGVLLLGDADTVAAAREWRWAVLQLERAVLGLADDDFDWVAAVRRADEARDRFYTAARASLTMDTGDVAQARWLMDRQMNS